MILEVEITDLEYKALSVVAYDPVEWVSNAAKVRARAAVEEVVSRIIQEALESGSSLPQGTKEEIFLAANLPTAKEVTDASVAELPPN